jgi:alpha-methylacyl-CoA racemase
MHVAADLQGVTILDLAGIGPAPRCLRVLADLGVRWIRLLPPSRTDRILPRWYHYGGLRGVEQMELDLKEPAARDVFLRLARQVDVIVESFRPGVTKRLGVDYESVRAVNPRAIYCSITGFGQHGPYAERAAHDLNYQALAGALAAVGRDQDGKPALPGLTLADSAGGGWHAAIRILAALVARQTSGTGQYLDVSASEGVLHLMAVAIDEFLATGNATTSGAGMLNGGYAFYDIYAAADGGWLAVAAIEPKFFAALCGALGLEQFISRQLDETAQVEIRKAFAQVFRQQSRAEWMVRLATVDACVTPVLSIAEVVTDPHWAARNMFCDYDHPQHGYTRQIAPFGGRPADQRGSAPPVGASDPDGVLTGFGFTRDEIAALKQANVTR